MSLIMSLVYQLLGLFDLLLLVYCVLSWLPIQAGQFTYTLRRIMDPVLVPIRKVLLRVLPPAFTAIDLSPIVAWILLSLVRKVLLFLL